MSGVDPDPHTTASAPPSGRRSRSWFRLGGIIAVLLLATWMASGGYDRLTAPNHRWKLPNGDTIEVLTFDNYYQGSYSLTGRGISGAHYLRPVRLDRKSTRLNSSHGYISYAVFCLKKKKKKRPKNEDE